jgi:hypothetical protein
VGDFRQTAKVGLGRHACVLEYRLRGGSPETGDGCGCKGSLYHGGAVEAVAAWFFEPAVLWRGVGSGFMVVSVTVVVGSTVASGVTSGNLFAAMLADGGIGF